jgi:HEAT repeat protein
MKCEELTELLPDYLQNSLPASSRTTVEGHLRTCADCSAHVEVWTRLGALPDEAPSPQLRMRFEAMLDAYEEGRARRAAWPFALGFRPALAYAAALSILVLGFVAGRYAQPDRGTPEIASLRTELSSTNDRIAALNQLVVLSMLQQQSASARLQGVDYSLQVRHPNPEIVGALLRSLRSDPSVDVRLAALDSLRRYGDDPGVRRGLLDSLPRKQSPLVQIALIDAMVELRDTEAVPHIRQLKDTPDVSPVVRDRARWGLAQLARG